MTDAGLEIARTKLTVKYLAEHSPLLDAESLLRSLRETVTFLERRVEREKLSIASKVNLTVLSDTVRAS